jgi:23S rRNA-/tRNA-specific pseudouridylate synthase
MGHPIAADKLYGFKNQQTPKGLYRQFLHASYLEIRGQKFTSELPPDLQQVLNALQPYDN